MTHLKAKRGITAGLAVTSALCLAPAAGAQPQDAAFLNRLQSVGITTSNPYATVMYAHGVCRQLDLGVPTAQIVDFVLSDNPSFDRKGAADYVVLAYMTYCPPA
ncbi:putative protein [Mycolicibacterium vanbaalenii]|uniref:DUF732 domain-containing protein n=1 Tax=Mycolicibacterium vanbaalenii TaxID=110539 RepID=A0A5S9RC35_MYCVN|nr:DUF732 domain-containing protein [Mycolicibacterium vanbaalenii]CAA0138202.1 putative protein [Mycolicibacterium vanbaalenii]